MRALLEHERPLAEFLFELACISVDLDAMRVQSMDDGGMGSLRIAPFHAGRRFGSCPAQCHFYDVNGVPITASLNLDQTGAPFEMDVWRVDFKPMRTWPLRADLCAGPANNSLKPGPQRGAG